MKTKTLGIIGIVVLGVICISSVVIEDSRSTDDNFDKLKLQIGLLVPGNEAPLEKESEWKDGVHRTYPGNPLRFVEESHASEAERDARSQPRPQNMRTNNNLTKNPSAYISFTFDDNKPSHLHTAAPILWEHNMTATRYYISGLDDSNFTECLVLRDEYGWEIGAHTQTHPDLTTISEEQVHVETCGCREDFANHGIDVETFAPPYVMTNENVTEIIKEYFDSSRVGWGVNYPPYNFYKIKMVSLDNRDEIDILKIREMIRSAKNNSGWIVFFAHRIDNTGDDFATNETFFREVVEFISKIPNIEVVTISEGTRILN